MTSAERPSPDPTIQPDAPAALDALAADYWTVTLERDPTFATAIGDPRFDDRLADPSRDGTTASAARLSGLEARAEGIEPHQLDAPRRVTLLALRQSIQADVARVGANLDDWNVDHIDGLPGNLLKIADYQRLETPDDGRRMVERWRAMPGYVDASLARLRVGLSEGHVACRAPVSRTIDILDSVLAEPDDRWPLVRPAGRAAELAGWSDADHRRLASDLVAAVRDGIRPAFQRYRSALANEILPAARTDDEPGIGHVPGGHDAYLGLVRGHTTLDLAPSDLHQIGLDEIARIDDELGALAGRVLGTSSLPEALARLRTDPSLHFETREQVYETADRCLDRAEAAIPAWFGRLPRALCDVVRMGTHEEAHSTIAYYRQPAQDGSRPGAYFINTSEPETRPRYEAEALAYHESVPGHHLQIAIAQEAAGLPAFRRNLGPTAFVEGWGLYSERLADEMGLYSGDLDRIGVLSFDAWRASRLVVDTGMHALGWTRDQALAFMLEHTALAPNNIANEVDRYIVLPAQALAYKAGQLELLRLRTEAMDRLGTRFDIRTFHDAVLDQGALPLAVLRESVEAWVAEAATGL
jgi:uncharacterized protein (DUF885 family)